MSASRKLVQSNALPITEAIRTIIEVVPAGQKAHALGDAVGQIKNQSSSLIQVGARLQYVRHLLKQFGAPRELIDIARDEQSTRAFNEHHIQRMRERASAPRTMPSIFAKQKVIDRLSGYRLSDAPDRLAISDVVLAGALRPAELETLRIHVRDGKYYATGIAKARDEAPRQFLSLIPEARFIELLEWIREHIVDVEKTAGSVRRWLTKNYDINLRDLRALGSQYIADERATSRTGRVLIQRIALRHEPATIASDHYGNVLEPSE